MTCEEIREQLPDYSLGTLSDVEATAIRRHLRGCTACRADATKLDEGVALSSRTAQVIEGSAVLYDSDKGQSWILVMARAPGYSGQLEVSVSAPGGRTIALRPIEIGAEGEGSTWFVTAADISAFHTVRLSD